MQVSILVNLWQKNALAGEIMCATTHLRSLQIQATLRPCCIPWGSFSLAESLITITLWQNHVFIVMAVAVDALVLGARAFADTGSGKFRSCSWIIPQGLAGDVSVTCAIIGLWLMITNLTFQYGEYFQILLHTRAHVCVCVCRRRINHSVKKCLCRPNVYTCMATQPARSTQFIRFVSPP